jgi:hypothetical protein
VSKKAADHGFVLVIDIGQLVDERRDIRIELLEYLGPQELHVLASAEDQAQQRYYAMCTLARNRHP